MKKMVAVIIFISLMMSPFASANQVKDIQEALNKAGYYVGKPDGVLGRNTRKIILKYQKDHGLKQTGKPNQETINKLKGMKISPLKTSMEKGRAALKKENYTEAVKWFKQASKQGNAEALVIMAGLYEQGIGVKKNPKLAIKSYLQAAKNGSTIAQTSLGLIYLNGDGVEKNIKKAKALFYKATKQGDVHAKFYLGKIFLDEENYKKAKKWLIKAASQGDKEAQFTLGKMYHQGLGVSKSIHTARYWLKQAAKQNHFEAQKMVDSLRSQ